MSSLNECVTCTSFVITWEIDMHIPINAESEKS